MTTNDILLAEIEVTKTKLIELLLESSKEEMSESLELIIEDWINQG